MSFSKSICLVLFLVFCNAAKTQVVAGNANLKILVAGLTNRIDLAYEGIKRKNLLVYCKYYKVIDSVGSFFIEVPFDTKLWSTLIYVGDKRSKNPKWLDSTVFRVKQNLDLVAQLGSLPPGEYNSWEIKLMSFIYAYLPNFWYDGVRANVVSYRFHYRDFNNLQYTSREVTGNCLDMLREQIEPASNGAEIIIDSVKAVLNNTVYMLKPLKYTIRGSFGGNRPGTVVLLSTKGRTIVYNPTDHNIDFESYPHKRLAILGCKDTIMLLERMEDSSNLVLFKRYYDSFTNVLQLESRRVSDTSFYVRYFNTRGICQAEGLSFEPLIHISKNINFYGGSELTFNKPVDSLRHWCRRNELQPFGQWKFYNANGNLFAKGNFHFRKLPSFFDNNGKAIIFLDDALPFNYYGPWEFYNEKGELIGKEIYELKY